MHNLHTVPLQLLEGLCSLVSRSVAAPFSGASPRLWASWKPNRYRASGSAVTIIAFAAVAAIATTDVVFTTEAEVQAIRAHSATSLGVVFTTGVEVQAI